MCLLTFLPDYVAASVLKCISLVEIAKADTAICNHSQRKYYLFCLNSVHISMGDDLTNASQKLYSWIIMRGLRFRKFQNLGSHRWGNILFDTLSAWHSPIDNLQGFNKTCIEMIQWQSHFHSTRFQVTEVVQFINSCPILHNLWLDFFHSDVLILLIKPTSLQRLKTLIHCQVIQSMLTVEHLSTWCTNLRKLHLQQNGGNEAGLSVADWIASNVMLESLELYGIHHTSAHLFTAITAHCLNLSSVEIHGCAATHFVSFALLVRECKKLKFATFRQSYVTFVYSFEEGKKSFEYNYNAAELDEDDDCQPASNSDLAEFITMLGNDLTELKLTGDQVEYTPDLWLAILTNHSRLHTIVLEDSFEGLNEQKLLVLSRMCDSLRRFTMVESLHSAVRFTWMALCFADHVDLYVLRWFYTCAEHYHHQYEVCMVKYMEELLSN
jgi:hypothetical protein